MFFGSIVSHTWHSLPNRSMWSRRHSRAGTGGRTCRQSAHQVCETRPRALVRQERFVAHAAQELVGVPLHQRGRHPRRLAHRPHHHVRRHELKAAFANDNHGRRLVPEALEVRPRCGNAAALRDDPVPQATEEGGRIVGGADDEHHTFGERLRLGDQLRNRERQNPMACVGTEGHLRRAVDELHARRPHPGLEGRVCPLSEAAGENSPSDKRVRPRRSKKAKQSSCDCHPGNSGGKSLSSTGRPLTNVCFFNSFQRAPLRRCPEKAVLDKWKQRCGSEHLVEPLRVALRPTAGLLADTTARLAHRTALWSAAFFARGFPAAASQGSEPAALPDRVRSRFKLQPRKLHGHVCDPVARATAHPRMRASRSAPRRAARATTSLRTRPRCRATSAALIKIGLSLNIGPGRYGRIAPRSGLAFKHGIDVLAGVIDADFRGEVGVILVNHTDTHFSVEGAIGLRSSSWSASTRPRCTRSSTLSRPSVDTPASGAPASRPIIRRGGRRVQCARIAKAVGPLRPGSHFVYAHTHTHTHTHTRSLCVPCPGARSLGARLPLTSSPGRWRSGTPTPSDGRQTRTRA